VKDLTPENKFDELVRGSLESFEMPHDASAWARFESKRAPQPAPSVLNSPLLKGAAAALVLGGIAAASYLLWPSDSTPEPLVVDDRSIKTPAPESAQTSESTLPGSQQVAPTAAYQSDAKTAVTTKAQPKTSPNDINVTPAFAESEYAERDDAQQSEKGVNGEAERSEMGGAPNQNMAALNLAIKMSKGTVCVGEEVRFMAVTGTGGLDFAWHFSDGEKRSRTEAARHFDAPGTYEVMLAATRGEQTWERSATIHVHALPMAEFEMVRPIPGIPMYNLNIELAEGDRCRWTFSDGRTSDVPSTRQLFRRRGEAGVELMVTNAHGCSSVEKRSVNISEEFRLFPPNIFTPNNGDGINDDFIPMALAEMDCEFEMLIRDVSGREVFRTSNVDHPWNGRENNTGNMLPSGPYIWTVVLKNDILTDQVFRGEITLQ